MNKYCITIGLKRVLFYISLPRKQVKADYMLGNSMKFEYQLIFGLPQIFNFWNNVIKSTLKLKWCKLCVLFNIYWRIYWLFWKKWVFPTFCNVLAMKFIQYGCSRCYFVNLPSKNSWNLTISVKTKYLRIYMCPF